MPFPMALVIIDHKLSQQEFELPSAIIITAIAIIIWWGAEKLSAWTTSQAPLFIHELVGMESSLLDQEGILKYICDAWSDFVKLVRL